MPCTAHDLNITEISMFSMMQLQNDFKCKINVELKLEIVSNV